MEKDDKYSNAQKVLDSLYESLHGGKPEDREINLIVCKKLGVKPSFKMLFGKEVYDLSRREILSLYTYHCFIPDNKDERECLIEIILNW